MIRPAAITSSCGRSAESGEAEKNAGGDGQHVESPDLAHPLISAAFAAAAPNASDLSGNPRGRTIPSRPNSRPPKASSYQNSLPPERATGRGPNFLARPDRGRVDRSGSPAACLLLQGAQAGNHRVDQAAILILCPPFEHRDRGGVASRAHPADLVSESGHLLIEGLGLAIQLCTAGGFLCLLLAGFLAGIFRPKELAPLRRVMGDKSLEVLIAMKLAARDAWRVTLLLGRREPYLVSCLAHLFFLRVEPPIFCNQGKDGIRLRA
jgi:hypothetical protein